MALTTRSEQHLHFTTARNQWQVDETLLPDVPGVLAIVGAIMSPIVGPGGSEHGRQNRQAQCSA